MTDLNAPEATPTTPENSEITGAHAAPVPVAPPTEREKLDLLLEVTGIPTASGKEGRVSAFVERWAAAREDVSLWRDGAGNLVLALRARNRAERKRRGREAFEDAARKPLFITAHMDHPAFVVEAVADGAVELSFRGGVQEVFFEHAPITIHAAGGPVKATLVGDAGKQTGAGKHYRAQVDGGAAELSRVNPGDVATWELPGPTIDAQGLLHTPGCDDLAALAAALATLDELRAKRSAGERIGDVRLLFTRAEEIGFVGAIAACRLGTMPAGSRVIALENSRSFADSPIGGGPIVRVGDRLTIFTPWLTAACCRRAEEAFGGASAPTASQKNGQAAARPWQRKLMSGGACEATVFCHAGYDATCICLPLGNYHNMPHLDALQAGTYDATRLGPPRCAPEFIHTRDYLGLVDLLVALALSLPEPDGQNQKGALGERLERMYAEKKYVLGEVREPTPAPAAATRPAQGQQGGASRGSSAKPARGGKGRPESRGGRGGGRGQGRAGGRGPRVGGPGRSGGGRAGGPGGRDGGRRRGRA